MASNNKSRKYKNRRLWTIEEEETLVGLWEEKIGELRGTRKNSHIYAEMTNRLCEMNIVSTPEEVRGKIHNLTNRYRNEKKSMSEGSPSQWHLFNKVHQVLGGLRVLNAELLPQDSIVENDEVMAPWGDLLHSCDSGASIFDVGASNISAASSSGPSSSTSSTSTRRSAKRRKKDNLDEEIRKTLKVIRDTSQEFIQKYVEIEKERNEHLKELINILKN